MGRRQARRIAFQMVFQIDVGANTLSEVMEMWEKYIVDNDKEIGISSRKKGKDTDVRDFAVNLVQGVTEHIQEIEHLLNDELKNWSIDRVYNVDRAILKIAVYELLYSSGIPLKVIINEAVETAKHFGSEDSASFINGVLANIYKGIEGRKDEL